MNVFISHITEESPIAKELKSFIERKFLGHITVFVSSDVSDLTPGHRWLNTIDAALKTCNIMLIICSPASLTRPWINFEAGCGWIKGIEMIPICHSGQRKDQLPFPFSEFQAIQLEDQNSAQLLLQALATNFRCNVPNARRGTLAKNIEKVKRDIYAHDALPQIIHSPRERTQLIINDLKTLLNSENVAEETVWTSSFLSAFAISKEDPYLPPEHDYLQLLLTERQHLIDLAQKGCTIKCIISPANRNYIRHFGIDYAIKRTEQLLRFLSTPDRALSYIDLAVSELGTKNFYIIGHVSCFEGYKKGLHQGYGLTLRQTSRDVINANIDVYGSFFADLAARTLAKWANEGDEGSSQRELLRIAVVRCLHESVKFLKDFQKNLQNAEDTCSR